MESLWTTGIGWRDLFAFLLELGDDLNQSDDVLIQRSQVLSVNPPFGVTGCANGLNRVTLHELPLHAEAGNIANPALRRVPIACNLGSILLVADGIENGLLWKSGRPTPEAALTNEGQLMRACRSVTDDGIRRSAHDFKANAAAQ